MATTNGWSDLPSDLFWKIIKSLRITDYTHAGAVCVYWRMLLSQNRHPPLPQLPWLMLAHKTSTVIDFFCPSESKTYHVQLPEMIGSSHRFIASSAGWLVSVDDTSELHMLNPLSATHIRLPSIATHGNITSITYTAEGKIAGYYMDVGHGDRLYSVEDMQSSRYLQKVVVSSSDPGSFTVVAIRNFSPSVSIIFTRSGDQRWTAFENPNVPARYGYMTKEHVCNFFYDAIFYGDHLYAVSGMGSVVAWNMSSHMPRIILIVPEPCCGIRLKFKYLVESPDGDLLQIQRDKNWVKVFVMMAAGKKIHCKYHMKYWGYVNTLGNYALFLGQNHSLALSVDGIPEMWRNCINFTDNSDNKNLKDHEHAWDVTRYVMGEGTLDQDCQNELRSSCPPIWFTPL